MELLVRENYASWGHSAKPPPSHCVSMLLWEAVRAWSIELGGGGGRLEHISCAPSFPYQCGAAAVRRWRIEPSGMRESKCYVPTASTLLPPVMCSGFPNLCRATGLKQQEHRSVRQEIWGAKKWGRELHCSLPMVGGCVVRPIPEAHLSAVSGIMELGPLLAGQTWQWSSGETTASCWGQAIKHAIREWLHRTQASCLSGQSWRCWDCGFSCWYYYQVSQ